VPDDLLEEAAAPGRFTPGDILRHIAATERWMWGENARLHPSRYPGHGPELAEGKAAVLAYLDEMHAQTVEILEGLTPEDLKRRCSTVGGVDLPVWKWLRLMVEHEIHHRGQLYETLGALGIQTPPLYGLTEPQVRERSRPAASGPDGEARSQNEDR
jgi:uncharacterized damage-inducible protein DinB